MKAAVFDTNVLVSGLLSPHGAPGWLVGALQQGICQAVVDDRIWDEYIEVLGRPAFGFPPSDIAIVLERIRRRAVHASPAIGFERQARLPDPDDAPFLACAAELDVPLVTGNLKHFPRLAIGNIDVRSPAAYVRRLQDT